MSNKKNGKISRPFDSCNNSLETERDKQSSQIPQYNEFMSPEEVFRGFEKIPQVMVKPMDLAPYLNTSYSNMNSKEIAGHKKQLGKKWIVRVQRDDLHTLQQTYKNRIKSPSLNVKPSLKCKICKKDYTSEKKLQNHLENKHTIISVPNKKVQKRVSFSDHVIVHEVKEYHSCRKCTKIFENYKSLKTHMKLKHKKRKCYICNYCSKEFMDRMFFKVHIKLHCNRCGLLFQSRSLHLEHKRNVCKQKKQYKCKTCNDIYFNFMDLKDHSYDHIGTFFICDICKDQFQRKCEVAHHISFSHSNERPSSLHSATSVGNDKLYHCNFCDKETNDQPTMELHTGVLPDLNNQVMTGYKDNVFCDQCLTKFSTEKEMLQHKWTHFLKKEKKRNFQTIFKLNEIPQEFFRAKVMIKRMDISKTSIPIGEDKSLPCAENTNNCKILSALLENKDTQNNEVIPNEPKLKEKQRPRKVLFSKYQCPTCSKYFSSGFTMRRHIKTLHLDFQDLQCKVCEEVFVWPSLLMSHKCIRLQHPEMPFDDARPEIQFDNLYALQENGSDHMSASQDMNGINYEVPSPIVSITESDIPYVPPGVNADKYNNYKNYKTLVVDPGNSAPYTVVMQEVPIEF